MKNLTWFLFFDSLKKSCSTPQQAMNTEYIKGEFFKITGNKISEKDEMVAVIQIFEQILNSKLAVREETLAKKTKEELSNAVISIANDRVKKRDIRIDWATGISLMLLTISIIAISYVTLYKTFYDTAYSNGYAKGYSESKDEKAAAAWANTPEGRQAYSLALAQAGNISLLTKCTVSGWTISKDKNNGKKSCIPYSIPGQSTIGWYIP